ncbi:MAG: Ig-like domain-containing protein, partial [Pseudomonadota bacterium]
MNEWFPREACSVLAAPILWCCAATSSATELELLLDAKALDGDCIVETIPEAQAAENVDFRLTVAIDATANTVTGVSLERCEGTTLGDPMLIDEGGYPIAVDAGEAGSDAIEFAVTTEVLDAEDAASLIAIANSSFDLLVAGFQVVFADGFEGVLVSKSAGIVIDGQVDDWLGIEPQLDPVGDSTGAAPGSDIVALFSAAAGDDLFFRVDIVDVENDAPTASASDAETTEDTPVAVTLSANDPDGDPLTFSIENDPTNGVLDAITNPSNSRAEVTYTPADDFDGEDSFTFSVQDPAGLESSATVSITVNSLPDAPTAVASSASTNEDEAIEIVLTGFDPDADALTFLIETTPTLGVLGAVTPLSSESASVVFTPSEDLNGDDFLTFTVSDGVTTSPPATVDISITPVNDPPSLTGNVMLTIVENDRGRFGYTGSDVDGDPLTFSVRGTDGEQFTISPAGFLGLIEQPDFEAPLDADENNVYRATVVLSDGDLEAELPVTLTVIAIDEPPVIISDGGDDDVDLEVDEGKTQVTRVTALDPERGVVSYLIDGGADAGAFELDAETGRLTFAGRTDFEAPDDSDNDGVYELEVIARDASGLDDRQAFRIALADAPLAFSATAASSYSAMCSPTGEINTDSLVLVFDEM